jgi:hypothetical protein
MKTDAGYRPWSQSIMLYLSRSWIATVIISVIYAGLMWLYLQTKAPVIILFMILFATITMVSARLKALQAYSLSYIAPGYRRVQLLVGLGMLVLLGWSPFLFGFKNHMTALQVFSLLAVGTGVGLLGDYKMPKFIGFSLAAGSIFCVVLVILKIRVSWDPTPILSTLLLSLGLALIAVYCKLIVAGKDYSRDFGTERAGAPASGFWVKDFRHALTVPHSQRKLSGGKIPRAVVRYQASDKAFLDFARLVNVSVGDWSYWRSVQIGIPMFCGLLIALGVIVGKEGFWELLPYLLALIIFNIQTIGAMAYVTQFNWPLRSIWMSSPLPTKDAHLKAMTAVVVFNVLYHYIQAVAVSFLIFWVADTFKIIGIYFAIALAVNIQAIALGLIFLRYKQAAFLLQFLAILSWLAAIGWLCHPFVENLWMYSLVSLATAIVTLALTLVWWFSGFFARNEYSLDY